MPASHLLESKHEHSPTSGRFVLCKRWTEPRPAKKEKQLIKLNIDDAETVAIMESITWAVVAYERPPLFIL